MRVLIVAATEAEIGGLRLAIRERRSEVSRQRFETRDERIEDSDQRSEISDEGPKVKDEKLIADGNNCPLITNHESLITNHQSLTSNQPTSNISFLITGVGMVATAFALGKELSNNRYDLVINLGIAGSFDRTIALGEVVEVIEDTFAELGAEDDEIFLPLDQMGFGEVSFRPSPHPIFNVRAVRGITVNKVHGNDASIEKIIHRLDPQVESMEGAAVFYACKQFNTQCLQIRAVSNYVEKRNREAWKIGLAVKNLNTFAADLVEKLIG
jgi:futalosine hydrolase